MWYAMFRFGRENQVVFNDVLRLQPFYLGYSSKTKRLLKFPTSKTYPKSYWQDTVGHQDTPRLYIRVMLLCHDCVPIAGSLVRPCHSFYQMSHACLEDPVNRWYPAFPQPQAFATNLSENTVRSWRSFDKAKAPTDMTKIGKRQIRRWRKFLTACITQTWACDTVAIAQIDLRAAAKKNRKQKYVTRFVGYGSNNVSMEQGEENLHNTKIRRSEGSIGDRGSNLSTTCTLKLQTWRFAFAVWNE